MDKSRLNLIAAAAAAAAEEEIAVGWMEESKENGSRNKAPAMNLSPQAVGLKLCSCSCSAPLAKLHSCRPANVY